MPDRPSPWRALPPRSWRPIAVALAVLVAAVAALGATPVGQAAWRHLTAADLAPTPRANPIPVALRDAAPPAGALLRPPGTEPTLDEMVGQLLTVGFHGDDIAQGAPQRMVDHIRAGRLGGVILFKRNVVSEGAVRRITAALRRAAPDPALPLLLAVDQEGGRVQRLTPAVGFPDTPNAEDSAAAGEPAARASYARLADNLATWGFNVNFGPVVDLAIDPENPVIVGLGRAYGPTPAAVLPFARAFVETHRAAGVLTALKHFPGHGSSKGDTHHGFVDVTATWQPAELDPYRALVAEGLADMVMVAHVAHAALTGAPDLPASLSPHAIGTVLRQSLGFTGVVVSDDLEMAAVAALGPRTVIAERALMAGNDILVFASNASEGAEVVAELHAHLVAAARADPAVEARVRESFARVARLKRTLVDRACPPVAAALAAPATDAPSTAPLPVRCPPNGEDTP